MSDTLILPNPSQQDDVTAVLAEAVASLSPDGRVMIMDWVVPGSHLRGKKANLQRRAGEYVNCWLALAGLGNGRYLSMAQWHKLCQQMHLEMVEHSLTDSWVALDQALAKRPFSPEEATRLRAMIIQAPEPVLQSLTPQILGDRITIRLQQLQLIGRKQV